MQVLVAERGSLSVECSDRYSQGSWQFQLHEQVVYAGISNHIVQATSRISIITLSLRRALSMTK